MPDLLLPALKVDALSVHYGKVQAVNGVSIDVAAGEIVSLLGANGAGKSTLLNAISGILTPSAGTVHSYGDSLSGATPWKIVSTGVVQVPEGRQIFPQLSVQEHLFLAQRQARAGTSYFAADDLYALFPRLAERKSVPAGNLSGGEQQMLAVGRALLTQPKVLLLDEPSLGLSPKLARLVISTIAGLREQGISILLVEQNASLALGVADRAYILANGKIIAEGTSEELRSSHEIRKAYLGE